MIIATSAPHKEPGSWDWELSAGPSNTAADTSTLEYLGGGYFDQRIRVQTCDTRGPNRILSPPVFCTFYCCFKDLIINFNRSLNCGLFWRDGSAIFLHKCKVSVKLPVYLTEKRHIWNTWLNSRFLAVCRKSRWPEKHVTYLCSISANSPFAWTYTHPQGKGQLWMFLSVKKAK